MTPMRPLIYSKNRCQQCIAVKRKLKMEGIEFDEVNIDDLGFTEQQETVEKLKEDGFQGAPVVYWTNSDGEAKSFYGFNIYEVEKLIEAHS